MGVKEVPSTVLPYTKNEEVIPGIDVYWDDFRVLLAVVRYKSFNRAANVLGLTQPTVSRRIERLEHVFKTQLVERTRNGAAITYEGQRVVEEISLAHAALARAITKGKPTKVANDPVRMSITDGIATYWMSRFMPHIFDQSPELEVQIFTSNSFLSEERKLLDLYIHYTTPADFENISIRLGTLHFLPYASPGYLESFGTPRVLSDLNRHRLLDFSMYLVDKGSWATRLADLPGLDQTQFFTNSSAVMGEAIRKGVGIGLLPTYASVFEEGITPIDIGLHYETPVWLSYRRDAIRRWPVRQVVQYMRAMIDRKAMPWFGDKFVHPSEFKPIDPKAIIDGIDIVEAMPKAAAALA